jgi:hypothetical protein
VGHPRQKPDQENPGKRYAEADQEEIRKLNSGERTAQTGVPAFHRLKIPRFCNEKNGATLQQPVYISQLAQEASSYFQQHPILTSPVVMSEPE